MTRAIIAFGANLPSKFGSPADTIHWSLKQIDQLPQTRILKVSSLHTTEAVGISFSPPPFTNAVALVETGLDPLQLLDELQALENATGRVRHRNPAIKLSRTLDLDIIAVEGITMDTERLTLPHPRAYEREFVQTPLQELQVDFV